MNIYHDNKGGPTKYSDSIVQEFECAFRIGLTDQVCS